MKLPSFNTFLVKAAVVLGLAAALGSTSGCLVVAAGAAGAGTVAYVRGELDAHVSADYEAVDRAARRAVSQLEFLLINEKRDAFTADITARSAADKKIEIKLAKQADNLTKVQIRIGLFGDEMMSRAILDRIKADL